jgi:hypothetical protein
MTMRPLPTLGFLVALGGGAAAFAQDPPPPLRDPTVPVPGSAPPRAQETPPVVSADPAAAPAAAPALALRGLVAVRGKPGAAVIEIGGTLLRHVTAGDELLWTDTAGRSLTLRVASLTADEVRLTIPAIAQTVVLR